MRVLLGRKTLRRLLEQADVSVRLNEMAGDGEWAEGPTRHDPLSPMWEKITRYPRNVLLGHVRKQVVPGCTAWQWRVALRRLLSASVVNPFREWLATLPEWDGQPRLDLMLDRVLDVDSACDPELASWAGRHYVMGAIARQLEGRGGDYSAVGEGGPVPPAAAGRVPLGFVPQLGRCASAARAVRSGMGERAVGAQPRRRQLGYEGEDGGHTGSRLRGGR